MATKISGGGKADPSASAADVDVIFGQIRALNTRYRNVVDKLTAIKKAKNKAEEKMDLLAQRQEIKDNFINKKQAARALIALVKVKNEPLAALKDRELKELQEDFRAMDGEFRELGVMQEREALFDSVRKRADDPSRMTNTELLEGALGTHKDTTEKLRDGLRVVEMTKVTAADTATALVGQREKLSNISEGLDNVEAELVISQKLITNFMKRAYTDKVIIAFTFLVLAGVVGIIIYATLNPDQKIFSVPDAVQPPTSFTSPSPSPA